MSLKGWGIALLLSPFTLGFSLIIYFYIWFFGKIGKFYIKAMTFSIKAAIGLIAWPFVKIFGGASWISRTFRLFFQQGRYNVRRKGHSPYRDRDDEEEEQEGGALSKLKSGLSFLTRYKFRYLAVFLGILWIFNYPSLVVGLLRDPTQYISVAGILELLPSLLLLSLPFIITLIISALGYEIFGDGTVFWRAKKGAVNQAKNLGATGAAAGGAVAGGAAAAGEAAKSGIEAGEAAKTAVTTASHIETAGGMIGGEAAAGEAAAAEASGLAGLLEGSALAGAASGALPVAAALALAWIMYTLIAGVISLVLVVVTWGMIAQVIPIVAGPVLGALGVGGAYAEWIGAETANSEAGMTLLQGDMFAPQMRAANQAIAKMGCIAKGPQCYRQWQMNNTVRPGSEARGERYELQISDFGLGTESVDVAYKEASYTLPVNFLVENTRNGLKGINARNVSYRISVVDSEKSYCSTGWTKISSFDDGRNYILPGLGVSPTESLEELNLGECDLLQPSLGVDRVMELQVRYNYASQATLYVDAMSRQYRREQNIDPGFKKSETADTPVQSYINVNSPITFYETESGDRNAVPFAARFGFETPGFNSKYKIRPESVQIVDSSVTTHTDTCIGLQQDSGMGEDYYEVSEGAKERITRRQSNSWFSADVEPAPLRCTMKIQEEDLGQISPTGEQLVMRIDGNYTIVKEDSMSGFDVQNTLCTRFNCPMLVTEEYNESSPYNLKSTCSTENSIDARNGCSLIDPSGSAGWRERDPVIVDGNAVTIERGKTAMQAENVLDSGGELNGLYGHTASNSGNLLVDSGDPVGAPNLNRRQIRADGVIYYQEESSPGNIQVEQIRHEICKEEKERSGVSNMEEAAENYMDVWDDQNDERKPVKIGANSVECKDWIDRLPFFEGSYQSTVNSCGGVVVSSGNNVICYGDSFN